MLTRSSTFFDSWNSTEELDFILEFRCGVGGGLLTEELVERLEEVEGDFFMGDPILEEGGLGSGGRGGGGGKSRLLSGGGGGNSGDWGCTCPPGCHLGLVFTTGGDMGLLGPSRVPGNWFAICLTRDDVGEMAVDKVGAFEGKLCCLGKVGGGWLGLWLPEKLCCFFIEVDGVGDRGGPTGETGDMPCPDGLGAVWGGNPPVNVLGGARGGGGGEKHTGGGGGGGSSPWLRGEKS